MMSSTDLHKFADAIFGITKKLLYIISNKFAIFKSIKNSNISNFLYFTLYYQTWSDNM